MSADVKASTIRFVLICGLCRDIRCYNLLTAKMDATPMMINDMQPPILVGTVDLPCRVKLGISAPYMSRDFSICRVFGGTI